MYYQVFYVKDHEGFDTEFSVVIYDAEKKPLFIINLDYDNTIMMNYQYIDFSMTRFIEHLKGDLEYKPFYSKKDIDCLLRPIRKDVYYKFDFKGKTKTLTNGFVKQLDNYGELTIINSNTKSILFSIETDFNTDTLNNFIYECVQAGITNYEDTEEYLDIMRKEEKEREIECQKQEKERLEKEAEMQKIIEQGNLREYYENILQEQERKHKEELIALKLKEIEELKK